MSTVITIPQLAQAVRHDEIRIKATEADLAQVLKVALKNRIAASALVHPVDIDLGNGLVLHCTVKKIIGPIHG